jgi:hypothetical protein
MGIIDCASHAFFKRRERPFASVRRSLASLPLSASKIAKSIKKNGSNATGVVDASTQFVPWQRRLFPMQRIICVLFVHFDAWTIVDQIELSWFWLAVRLSNTKK